MIPFIYFIFLLFTTSFYLKIKYNKKFEETSPIIVISIILILYLCGLMEILKLGIYIIILLNIFSIILTIINIIKNKINILNKIKEFITPGLIIWLTLYLIFYGYFIRAFLTNWDEFTHWGVVVKSMYYNNSLSVNDNSLWFQNYPPGISLFQYFFQIINGTFKESLLYFSYQVLYISMIIYFTKEITFKDKWKIILAFFAILCMPLVFFHDAYSSIYVDSILGITFGYLIALACFKKKDDKFYWMNVFLTIFLLVLFKDSGKLFAIIGMITIIISTISISIKKFKISEFIKNNYNIIIMIIVFLLTMVSWNIKVKISNPNNIAFSNSVNIIDFFKVLIGKDHGYRLEVFNKFVGCFLSEPIIIFQHIKLTSIQFLGLFILLAFFINKFINKENKKDYDISYVSIIIGAFVYAIGLLIIYMFKFSKDEAVSLASYARYISTYFTSFIIFIFCILIKLNKREMKINNVFILILIMIIIPFYSLFSDFYNKMASFKFRKSYIELTDKAKIAIQSETKNKSNIYIISEESDGFDYFVLSYSLKEVMNKNNNRNWSIGSYKNKNIFNDYMDVNKWREMLKDYDYVLIYNITDKFKEEFKTIFENEDSITANTLYKYNKEKEILEKR